MRHVMVVGTSEPQDFALLNNGAPIPSAGALTVGVEWPGDQPLGSIVVAWLDPGASTVRVTGCEAMAVGDYEFRFTLTDSDGQDGYAPNEDLPDIWSVVPV